MQRSQECGTAQPHISLPGPPVQHGVRASPASPVEALHEGTDDVDGERIDQSAQSRSSDKPLNAGQVRVPKDRHLGLQENHGSKAAFEDRHVP
jgi:hypothetical protein